MKTIYLIILSILYPTGKQGKEEKNKLMIEHYMSRFKKK